MKQDNLEVRGFTAAEAAGIVGNLWHESSAYLSPGDPGLVPWVDYCNGCAYGLAQWDPARQKQLREHEGEKADTFGGQLEFVYYDLAQSQRYNQTYGAILGDTHDVYKATLDFMNGYEGPGSPEFPDRLQKARTICARYGGC